MSSLTQMTCEACHAGAPPATEAEIQEWMAEIPEWELIEQSGTPRLRRTFRFKDFAGALAFTNAAGEIAEQEGHHPRIVTQWGRVTITTWTHAINNLHRNDFILAAKIDERYREHAGNP